MQTSNLEEILIKLGNAINSSEQDNSKILPLVKETKVFAPNSKLVVKIQKEKEPKRYCDGYCAESNKEKYRVSQMVIFPDHDHVFCGSCIFTWVIRRIHINPHLPIYCQRCTILSKSNFYQINEFFITSYIMPLSTLQMLRMNIKYDPILDTMCCICDCILPKKFSLSFGCMHNFCEDHKKNLINGILEKYSVDIKNCENIELLNFEFACTCKGEGSRVCVSHKDVVSIIKSYGHYGPFQKYKKLVDKNESFFMGKNILAKCHKCAKIFEKSGKEIVCMSCSWCVRGNHETHQGMTCEEMNSLSHDYTLSEPFSIKDHQENLNLFKQRLVRELIAKNPSSIIISSIWDLTNPYKNIIFANKRVWKYGFLKFKSLSEIKNFLQTPENDDEKLWQFNKDLTSAKSGDFSILCELKGFYVAACENKNHKSGGNAIVETASSYSTRSLKNIRMILCIQIE